MTTDLTRPIEIKKGMSILLDTGGVSKRIQAIHYLGLEALDFVVNPKTQGLMGNPEHEGKWMVELY